MNIITKPSVYLIASQTIDQDEVKRFEQDESVYYQQTTHISPQNLVEFAGRVCYMSFAKPRPGGNAAYIQHILEVGHGSVLEHAVFSLLITGVSRSLTHELIRHRAGFGYSQLSQRFVDESDCDFVLPPGIIGDSDNYDEDDNFIMWKHWCEDSARKYKELAEYLEEQFADIEDKTLRRKRAREAARSVLPNCTATKIFMTGNARAWRHFIELRGSEHADAEINRLARAVLVKLQSAAPNLFGDYTVTNNVIDTPFRKV